jgi:hypothetical protein
VRAPDLERARESARAHLALVQDPSPPAQIAGEPGEVATDGEAADVAAPAALDASALAPACTLAATLAAAWIADRWGAHWMVTPERADRIGNALARVVLKYAPSLGSYGPEAELGVALGDWLLAVAGPQMLNQAAAVQAAPREVVPEPST